MRIRQYEEIFPENYPFPPDKEEVKRTCRIWWNRMYEVQSLWPVTSNLNNIVDPFLREYTVTVMHQLIMQDQASGDPEMHLSPEALQHLLCDLRHITRHAWDEQFDERLNYTISLSDSPTPPTSDHLPKTYDTRLDQLEQQMKTLRQVVVEWVGQTNRHTNGWLWPTYMPDVADEEKRVFEKVLKQLCSSHKRNTSAEIKTYLKTKEQQGIILRPKQINSEFEYLLRFGYPFKDKAYYKA